MADPTIRVVRGRRPVDAPEETTWEDVCYFRALVACLEAGGDDLWDLPCARLALAAIERRWQEISAAEGGKPTATSPPLNSSA